MSLLQDIKNYQPVNQQEERDKEWMIQYMACNADCLKHENEMAHFCEHMIGYGTTVNGGFAEYCAVNERQVCKLEGNTSIGQAIDIAGSKAVVMMFGLTKPDASTSAAWFTKYVVLADWRMYAANRSFV